LTADLSGAVQGAMTDARCGASFNSLKKDRHRLLSGEPTLPTSSLQAGNLE
jgi:hypothetical protein